MSQHCIFYLATRTWHSRWSLHFSLAQQFGAYNWLINLNYFLQVFTVRSHRTFTIIIEKIEGNGSTYLQYITLCIICLTLKCVSLVLLVLLRELVIQCNSVNKINLFYPLQMSTRGNHSDIVHHLLFCT